MVITTVVGARPQFVKAAAVSRKLREQNTEILIHTGQHYDKNMSENFFVELGIPLPDYYLGAGSGTQARQTADMLTGIENILVSQKTDAVLVYGDTNSTLAGALAAAKLHIPVVHVEAGLRSYNRNMPEEINRVITDHISDILFCPTDTAVDNLSREGITKDVYQVGDVMCDTVLYYSGNMDIEGKNGYFSRLNALYGEEKRPMPEKWYLATIHRAENTEGLNRLENILAALESLPFPVIFPVHPRIRAAVEQLHRKRHYGNLLFSEPFGYLDMLYFTKNAEKVITDSGGLQKECYILKTPCVTVREQTEWVETLKNGHNILAMADKDDIVDKVLHVFPDTANYVPWYGDGNAAGRMVGILNKRYGNE